MKKNRELKPQVDRLRDFVKKIVALESDGAHVLFHNEFGSEWKIIHNENKFRQERYAAALQELGTKYSFEDSEIPSLETHLQEGGIIVLTMDYEPMESEAKRYKPTRDWETVWLVRRVTLLRKQGWKYEAIADYYNDLLKSLKIEKKVTTSSLRTLMSRANNRLQGKLEQLEVNL